MNILLLNHYAGAPKYGMEFRPYYLAREWVRAGHRVTIVGGSWSHVRARQPGRRRLLVAQEDIDGIQYLWIPTPAYRGNGIGRVGNISAFLAQVWIRSASLVRQIQPDVVIASSTYPLDIWVARRLARRSKARLVYEVHDLWPLSPIELGGMSPRHPFIRVCQAAENAAYREADTVVSMLPNVSGHMASHGLDLRKLVVIPNGFSPEEWEGPAAPLDDAISRHLLEARLAGLTIVGYAGSHGLPNALMTLLDAAARLRHERFAFVLVGDGQEKQALRQHAANEKLQNVAFFPPIPKAQVRAFLAGIDIAYIGWQKVPIYRFGISPNKLMDYMMAGCVVLHSVDAGNDPVAEAGCGLTVPPVCASSVVEGLRRLASLAPEERQSMGRRGRDYVRGRHAYPQLAQEFLRAVAR